MGTYDMFADVSAFVGIRLQLFGISRLINCLNLLTNAINGLIHVGFSGGVCCNFLGISFSYLFCLWLQRCLASSLSAVALVPQPREFGFQTKHYTISLQSKRTILAC